MSDQPPETEYSISDKLLNRMESFASDLMVLSGMTRRGGVLPATYRRDTLPPMRRMLERLLDALAEGRAVQQPWDRSER